FRRNEDGNLAVTFSMCLLPILLAVGVATDYSSATHDRSSMQNALDAAILSLTALPETMPNTERETKLKEFYAGNGGTGTAKLDSFSINAVGEVDAKASASYDMPTSFMQLANVTKVPISVVAEMHKQPTLIEAKFEIEKASGWWNKTMTLKGRKYGQTANNNLMKITYAYNNAGESKGYGTTSVYKVTKNAQGNDVETLIQQQVCNTYKGSSTWGDGASLLKNNEMSQTPALTMTSGSFTTKCWYKSGLASDTFIDVSTMEDIYLQMDVPSGNPSVLKSNDPNTADRLYLDGIEVVPNGKPVDIFTAVPCGQTSPQAWEDGGNATPAPVSNADFFYKVTGKCDYSQRPIGISLTK
ncbi:MAG: TadE/TadG family type IV pilus assembly protein, partial [Rhizobiaceae bacterium]